jgi:CheY-like chemotaxis protein
VLVVDDEPAQRRTARRVLSHQGYQVDTAHNGKETIDRFTEAAASQQAQPAGDAAAKSPYDAVVMDMNLNEEEDGLALFERIRQMHPNQKGVLVSGYAKPERAELSIERGLLWLAKPYGADALVRVVRAAVAGRDAGSR